MSRNDDRQYAPATSRNREPILGILRSALPGSGLVLEVASGTGEHIVHFARALPMLTWQPSDPSEGARRSIAARIAAEGLNNLCPPLGLDFASQRAVGRLPFHQDAVACYFASRRSDRCSK